MVTRRYFLHAVGLAGAAAFGAGCADRRIRLQGAPTSTWRDAVTVQPAPSAAEAIARAADLRTELRIAEFPLTIGSDQVTLRAYNGAITGPELRLRAGATLTVDIVNDLPSEPMEGHDVNGPHELNTTNLHAHGLHVSPLEGDNVFIAIPPGGRQPLVYRLPEDHHAGTFWYHPHKHGSVAVQVASGMAGALIVEGDIDAVPEIAAAHERTFLFQQIPYNAQGRVEWADVVSTFTRNTTINGALNPRIEMRPGEVQRWRFIHGGVAEKLSLVLEGHSLSVIAYDGITTGRRDDLTVPLELFPGNRADVLVKATAAGQYRLFDQRDSRGLLGRESGQLLATLDVAGEVMDMPLPTSATLSGLTPFEDLRQVQPDRVLDMKFSVTGGGQIFKICGRPFDPDAPPIETKLGGVDEFVVVSQNGGNHPFHIHVNPFQVVQIGDKPVDTLMWRDTIGVDRGVPVRLRMRHRRFLGLSVIHCHILHHEDRGMMVKFEIVDREPAQFTCL